MRFSIVENLSWLSGSIFSLFKSPQFNFRTKSKHGSESINFIDFFQNYQNEILYSGKSYTVTKVRNAPVGEKS